MIAASDKVAAAILRNGLPDMLFHALLGPDSQSRGHPYSCHPQWKCQCVCVRCVVCCVLCVVCLCVCVSGGLDTVTQTSLPLALGESRIYTKL